MVDLNYAGATQERPLVVRKEMLDKILPGVELTKDHYNQNLRDGIMHVKIKPYDGIGVAMVSHPVDGRAVVREGSERTFVTDDGTLKLEQMHIPYEKLVSAGDKKYYYVPNTDRVLPSLARLSYEITPHAWVWLRVPNLVGVSQRIETQPYLNALTEAKATIGNLRGWMNTNIHKPADFLKLLNTISRITQSIEIAYNDAGLRKVPNLKLNLNPLADAILYAKQGATELLSQSDAYVKVYEALQGAIGIINRDWSNLHNIEKWLSDR